MPAISESILTQLNAPARIVPDTLSTDILPGHMIGKPEHLFKKIEEKMVNVWRSTFNGSETKAAAVMESEVAASSSKRKTASKKGPIYSSDVQKTPEMLALEAKILEQGQVVRTLKGQTLKTSELEAQIKNAVAVLLALKKELAAL